MQPEYISVASLLEVTQQQKTPPTELLQRVLSTDHFFSELNQILEQGKGEGSGQQERLESILK
jgi:hypothetical protein